MNINGFDPAQAQQQFMDLMVAQIQYQDPLNPVSQENTTAQLAQISTVSGINQLNQQFSELLKTQSLFQGTQLVGSLVEYQLPLSSERATGLVDSARVSNGHLELSVNSDTISINDITAVIHKSDPAP